jgi:hypothetical protein
MVVADELVESIEVDGETYDVYGLYDSETPEGEFDSYDVWRRNPSELINPGDSWYELPTAGKIRRYLKENPIDA